MQRAWLLLALALVPACSAVVGGSVPASGLPCLQLDGEPNPCLTGEVCREGLCVPDDTCVPGCTEPLVCRDGTCELPPLEVCNQMDDNGNGLIDEDLARDDDADGYPTCAMDVTLIDCVDRAGFGAGIHPGAPELCDGIDNDCNPSTSELDPNTTTDCPDRFTHTCTPPIGGTTPICLDRMSCRNTGCMSDELCDQVTDRCIPDVPPTDCRMVGMDCRMGTTCNVDTGLCDEITGLPLGEICNSNAECTSGVCYEWSALMMTSTREGSLGRCGAPCCNHASCTSDAACWAPGTGARSCMPRSLLGADADVALCTQRSQCPGARQTCRIASVTGTSSDYVQMVCGEQIAPPPFSCESGNDCPSGICSGGVCSIACGSRADCEGFDFDLLVPVYRGACTYFQSGDDFCTACAALSPGALAGERCGGDEDCVENFCRDGRCSGVCCADSDCGGGACRPVYRLGSWEMRCTSGSGPM